jgi:hypothetical protein
MKTPVQTAASVHHLCVSVLVIGVPSFDVIELRTNEDALL